MKREQEERLKRADAARREADARRKAEIEEKQARARGAVALEGCCFGVVPGKGFAARRGKLPTRPPLAVPNAAIPRTLFFPLQPAQRIKDERMKRVQDAKAAPPAPAAGASRLAAPLLPGRPAAPAAGARPAPPAAGGKENAGARPGGGKEAAAGGLKAAAPPASILGALTNATSAANAAAVTPAGLTLLPAVNPFRAPAGPHAPAGRAEAEAEARNVAALRDSPYVDKGANRTPHAPHAPPPAAAAAAAAAGPVAAVAAAAANKDQYDMSPYRRARARLARLLSRLFARPPSARSAAAALLRCCLCRASRRRRRGAAAAAGKHGD